MAKKAVYWSNLPKELLAIIGKSLDPLVDVPRFRGVCTSWRSSIPSAHALSPRFPLEFESPWATLNPGWEFEPRARLFESRLYLVKPLNPLRASTSCKQGWLIMVEYDSCSRRFLLYDPFTGWMIHHKPKTLSLLNCRTVELGKAYTFRQSGTYSDYGSMEPKVVMFTSPDDSAAFFILNLGSLFFAREGNEKFIMMDDREVHYDYTIVYQGKFYCVDEYRILWRIESSSLKMVQVLSSPLSGFDAANNRKNYLVESCGSLYLIITFGDLRVKLYDLEVYKLDEEHGRWVLIRSLGDHAFFLGNDYSFSILASELVGCKKNYIYVLEQDGIGGIFDMESRNVQKVGVRNDKISYNLPFFYK